MAIVPSKPLSDADLSALATTTGDAEHALACHYGVDLSVPDDDRPFFTFGEGPVEAVLTALVAKDYVGNNVVVLRQPNMCDEGVSTLRETGGVPAGVEIHTYLGDFVVITSTDSQATLQAWENLASVFASGNAGNQS